MIQNPGGMELPTDENGKLVGYAWPGGYTIVYSDYSGNYLCVDCANEEPTEMLAYIFHQEGPSIFCDECGIEIESDYGDPNE